MSKKHYSRGNHKGGQRPRKETANPLSAIDRKLAEMEADMDKSFMDSGKTAAELFRTVCSAALKLPNMSLRTELMSINNADNCLSVVFYRNQAKGAGSKSVRAGGYEHSTSENYDDEEGFLYDGD